MKPSPIRILLLNQYFPPDGSATAKVAQQLVNQLTQKHKVTCIVGRPSYNVSETSPYYLYNTEKKDNLQIVRVGSTTNFRGRMRHRLANYLSYLMLAFPQSLIKPADIIVSMTDPPIVGILAALAAKLRHKPFIYYIQDLHPDMAIASGIVKQSGWVNGWEKLHRWVLRQATQIIVLGDDMKALVVAKGIPKNRVKVIRSGAPIPENLPDNDHPVIQEIRQGFNFVAIHAGNLGFYGDWNTLINAVKLLNNDKIGLLFIGGGATKETLQKKAQHNSHIKFLPFRPIEEIPLTLAAADIHIITIREGLEGVIVPSKLYPILAAGRPILAIVPKNSDVAILIRKHKCGVVIPPGNPKELAKTLQSLSQTKSILEEMGRNARNAAEDYKQGKMFAEILNIIEQTKLAE